MPYGSVPIMTLVDGTVLAESMAILRLAGKASGLYPEDPLNAQRVDEFVDFIDNLVYSTVNDTGKAEAAAEQAADQRHESPDGGRKTGDAKLLARQAACLPGGKIHSAFGLADAFIAKNGQNGCCVGGALTLADIYLFCGAGNVSGGFFDGCEDICEQFPNVQAVRRTVASQPAVAAYYAARAKAAEGAEVRAAVLKAAPNFADRAFSLQGFAAKAAAYEAYNCNQKL